MEETITVVYQPILYVSNQSSPAFSLTFEGLMGMTLMTSQIISLDRISQPGMSSAGLGTPSTIYIMTRDNKFTEMLTTAATPMLIALPTKYHTFESYYIYNVGAKHTHSGQGLAKSILMTLINDLIGIGIKSFLLEVDPNNITAYNLYTGLGFQKIDNHAIGPKWYDLLYLPINVEKTITQ